MLNNAPEAVFTVPKSPLVVAIHRNNHKTSDLRARFFKINDD
jgi:hypothetical protein